MRAQPRARAATPAAGARAPACAIAAAGSDFEAAASDFQAAGPDFEATGPDKGCAPHRGGASHTGEGLCDKFAQRFSVASAAPLKKDPGAYVLSFKKSTGSFVCFF